MSTAAPTPSSATMKTHGSDEATGSKRGPKPKDTTGTRTLYFVGDVTDGKPVLEDECKTEDAALLQALKTGKFIFEIKVWSVKKSSVS